MSTFLTTNPDNEGCEQDGRGGVSQYWVYCVHPVGVDIGSGKQWALERLKEIYFVLKPTRFSDQIVYIPGPELLLSAMK
jgi:hypothetical protein